MCRESNDSYVRFVERRILSGLWNEEYNDPLMIKLFIQTLVDTYPRRVCNEGQFEFGFGQLFLASGLVSLAHPVYP